MHARLLASGSAALNGRDVDAALARVAAAVDRDGGPSEREYFRLHRARYGAMAIAAARLVAPPALVLDLGSHFLHQGCLLKALGYRVVAVDVPAFAARPDIVARATDWEIPLHAVPGEAQAEGRFLDGHEDAVDLVLFTETLEHITFNPIAFWARVHTLLRVGGHVYLTTPNGITLLSWLGQLLGLLRFRRIGIPVHRVLGTVTWGHHWKEYSAAELVEYFARLSPDFRVAVRRTYFPGRPTPFAGGGVADAVRTALRWVGNRSGFFAEQLEAVVTLQQRTPWRLEPPRDR